MRPAAGSAASTATTIPANVAPRMSSTVAMAAAATMPMTTGTPGTAQPGRSSVPGIWSAVTWVEVFITAPDIEVISLR
jgi:hypothetical protein